MTVNSPIGAGASLSMPVWQMPQAFRALWKKFDPERSFWQRWTCRSHFKQDFGQAFKKSAREYFPTLKDVEFATMCEAVLAKIGKDATTINRMDLPRVAFQLKQAADTPGGRLQSRLEVISRSTGADAEPLARKAIAQAIDDYFVVDPSNPSSGDSKSWSMSFGGDLTSNAEKREDGRVGRILAAALSRARDLTVGQLRRLVIENDVVPKGTPDGAAKIDELVINLTKSAEESNFVKCKYGENEYDFTNDIDPKNLKDTGRIDTPLKAECAGKAFAEIMGRPIDIWRDAAQASSAQDTLLQQREEVEQAVYLIVHDKYEKPEDLCDRERVVLAAALDILSCKRFTEGRSAKRDTLHLGTLTSEQLEELKELLSNDDRLVRRHVGRRLQLARHLDESYTGAAFNYFVIEATINPKAVIDPVAKSKGRAIDPASYEDLIAKERSGENIIINTIFLSDPQTPEEKQELKNIIRQIREQRITETFGKPLAETATKKAIVSKVLGRMRVIYDLPVKLDLGELSPEQDRKLIELLENEDIVQDIRDDIDQLPERPIYRRERAAIDQEKEIADNREGQSGGSRHEKSLLKVFETFENKIAKTGADIVERDVRDLIKTAVSEGFPRRDGKDLNAYAEKLHDEALSEVIKNARSAQINRIKQLVIAKKVVPDNLPNRERRIEECVDLLVKTANNYKAPLFFRYAGGRDYDFSEDVDRRDIQNTGKIDTLLKVQCLRGVMVELLRQALLDYRD